MTANVHSGTTTVHGTQARCDVVDCTHLPLGSTRERARQHVKHTGHTVRYYNTTVTTYTPKGQPQ